MRAFVPSSGTSCARALRRHRLEKLRQFRYGVQVNSLGLTEAAAREQRVAHRRSRRWASRSRATPAARAVQLPTWNEALGLPRPWDQQWSLRLQQVLAYETDLLEYPDLFDGNAGGRRGRRL